MLLWRRGAQTKRKAERVEGVLRLGTEVGLFAEPKVVLWKQVQKYVARALTRPRGNVADKQAPSYLTALGHMDCMFRVALVAVCEVDENQYLAANFLTHYAAMLVEQFKSP